MSKPLDIPKRIVLLAALVLAIALLARSSLRSSGDAIYPGVGNPLPPLMVAGWLNGHAPEVIHKPGDVVVIDCWASWCGPCRSVAPQLVRSYQRYLDRGVRFVGLTPELAGSMDDMQGFVDDYQIEWPIGYGAMHALEMLGVEAYPTVLVVGRDGRIAYGRVGWGEGELAKLNAAIERALEEANPPSQE